MQKTWVQPLGQEDPLEEEMATHSSNPAWRIPWTEEPHKEWDMIETTQHSLRGRMDSFCEVKLDLPNRFKSVCKEVGMIMGE